ncbi:MAG: Recombinase [Firmicutes bacterium]|nr:Recombinase [Bacillota bacterium]
MNKQSPPLEPACFYLRKSREDQEAEARGEGETLAKHRKALLKLAKEYDITVTKVFEEIISGESLIHRPQMLTMLKEVAEGHWKSVWCMDVDRLGRGGMQDQGLILETFKNAHTLIVTPRKIYDLSNEFDEEYTEFEAFMARKELKIITRRLQGGRRRSVEEGNYIGTRPPYGYLIEKTPTSRVLIPHPEQADIVKLIFALYTNDDPQLRMGSSKIAAELNRMKKTTYTGRAWESSTVLSILKNEVYTGRIQWRKKEAKKSTAPGKKETVRTRSREEWIDVKGKHEPLITQATFCKAQEILKGKYHVPYQLVNGITNPLAGLIRCDICGCSMVYRTYTHQKYPHIICYNPKCTNKSSRFDYVETALLDGLKIWLDQYQNILTAHSKPEQTLNLITIKAKTLKNLQQAKKDAEQQKGRLHDLLEKGIYDAATYLERSAKMTERIAAVEKAIIETAQSISIEKTTKNIEQEIIPKIGNLLSSYHKTTDPALKNHMLKSILEYAVYRKEQHQQ